MTPSVLSASSQRPHSSRGGTSHSVIERQDIRELIIHTGQHFDADLSDTFSREVALPAPVGRLGFRGDGNGEMTGRMGQTRTGARGIAARYCFSYIHHRGLPKVDWQFALAMVAYGPFRSPKRLFQPHCDPPPNSPAVYAAGYLLGT
jgi:hypothetical protein